MVTGQNQTSTLTELESIIRYTAAIAWNDQARDEPILVPVSTMQEMAADQRHDEHLSKLFYDAGFIRPTGRAAIVGDVSSGLYDLVMYDGYDFQGFTRIRIVDLSAPKHRKIAYQVFEGAGERYGGDLVETGVINPRPDIYLANAQASQISMTLDMRDMDPRTSQVYSHEHPDLHLGAIVPGTKEGTFEVYLPRTGMLGQRPADKSMRW